ncbi:MAG: hypothetical protein PHY02_11075 [Phycisphaerae bacterium]|nr:hypothetical protein [Phycisphaerae bacterium]
MNKLTAYMLLYGAAILQWIDGNRVLAFLCLCVTLLFLALLFK